MTPITFDGKKAAEKLLNDVSLKISEENLHLKLVTLLVGENKASKIYTKMKQKAAARVGATMESIEIPDDVSVQKIKEIILQLNNDNSVSGIMVQLPLPDSLRKQTAEIIQTITPQKDVDGLLTDSPYLSATVQSIHKIFTAAQEEGLIHDDSVVAIVGAKGEVGSKAVKLYSTYRLICVDIEDDISKIKDADVIIAATGKANVIQSDHIKKGSVLIDVGAPKPEFEKSCYDKCSFYSPVPGGVGPLTIASLMQNLLYSKIGEALQ